LFLLLSRFTLFCRVLSSILCQIYVVFTAWNDRTFFKSLIECLTGSQAFACSSRVIRT